MSHQPLEITPEESREFLGVGMFGVLIAIGMCAWFVFYVQPRDEFLGSVMECMDGDTSEAAYDRCVETTRSGT